MKWMRGRECGLILDNYFYKVKLILLYFSLGDDDIKAIRTLLSVNSSLTSLNLTSNYNMCIFDMHYNDNYIP